MKNYITIFLSILLLLFSTSSFSVTPRADNFVITVECKNGYFAYISCPDGYALPIPVFGTASSTFAADNGWLFAETFDNFDAWVGDKTIQGNVDPIRFPNNFPNITGQGIGAWSYYSNWVSANPTAEWIGEYGDETVWRGTKSLTMDIGGTGLGPSRFGIHMGEGFDDVHIFFMVRITKNQWPTSCEAPGCSGYGVGTYTEGQPYNYWAAWKFFTPQVGCPDVDCYPYSPIFNWVIGLMQYNYRNDPGITFNMVEADHDHNDWLRLADGESSKNLDSHIGEWMGVEFRFRANNTHHTVDAWIYDECGNATVVGENHQIPTPPDAIDQYYNNFFFGGNNSLSYQWGASMQSHYNIDDVIVNDGRIGPNYFAAINILSRSNCQ